MNATLKYRSADGFITHAGLAAVILQWLHRAGWTARQRCVACVHPSRLATLTAANSAADDCRSRVGAAVGYSIPFEEVATPVRWQHIGIASYMAADISALQKQAANEGLCMQGLTCMRHTMDEALLREVAAADPLFSNYRCIRQRQILHAQIFRSLARTWQEYCMIFDRTAPAYTNSLCDCQF